MNCIAVALPLEKLLANSDNRYGLASAIIRRATQLVLTGDEELDQNDGRVVSTSINQILTKKVKYQIEK